MRKKVLISLLASLGLLFLLMPAAQADTLIYVGASNGDSHGIYLGPYTLSVNGSNMALLCDDFTDHVAGGDTWTATEIWGGDNAALATTRMAQLSGYTGATLYAAYDAKAWLEMNMNDSNRAVYSFAIWDVFQPTEVAAYLAPYNDGFLAQVQAAVAGIGPDTGLRDNLTIYSPSGTITSGPDEGKIAQEFDTVPDGGVTLMLLGGALVGLATLRRKFRV